MKPDFIDFIFDHVISLIININNMIKYEINEIWFHISSCYYIYQGIVLENYKRCEEN
jgi:hypothetical protein